jgi:hypothetical protein
MYGYHAVLSALRVHARKILANAHLRAERDRLSREYAEYVLRNRAKLLLVRLGQTSSDTKRREILRQALLGV